MLADVPQGSFILYGVCVRVYMTACLAAGDAGTLRVITHLAFSGLGGERPWWRVQAFISLWPLTWLSAQISRAKGDDCLFLS